MTIAARLATVLIGLMAASIIGVYIFQNLTPLPKRRSSSSLNERKVRRGNTTINLTKAADHYLQHRASKDTMINRKLILLAYMRGGSTITGELFNGNDDVFYWFEPLAAVTESWGWDDHQQHYRYYFHHPNGTERVLGFAKDQTLTKTLYSVLSCDAATMDTRLFTHRFMTERWSYGYNLGAQSFRRCRKRRRRSYELLKRCLPRLVNACQRRKVTVAKVIRLPMRLAAEMLAKYNDVQLIHLVRDPRGILESWRKFRPDQEMADAVLNAQLLCRRMLNESVIRRQLQARYPDRVLLIRYEDLVTQLHAVTAKIYQRLLRLPVSAKVQSRVKRMIVSKGSHSWRVATSWRRTIGQTRLDIVTKICKPLLQELRYML